MSFWKRGFPILLVLFLVWALAHFFLDRGIERAIEAAGTAANGARVDVGGVSTSFFRLSGAVRKLEIADKESPMSNLVEIDRLRLKLSPKPLFWKKFVVERAEILGVRTGTPRRRSGALPEKARGGAAPGMVNRAAANVKAAYDPDKLLSPDRLESYKKVQSEKERLSRLPEEWKARLASLQVEPLQKDTEAFLQKAKAHKPSLQNLAETQLLLKEGQALRRRLGDAQKTLKDSKAELAAEAARTKAAMQEIDRLRRQDLDRAIAEAKSLGSVQGLTRALLGPVVWNKLESGVAWFARIRALIPAKGEAEQPPARERRGQDIAFPFRYHWPAFHLVTAKISGEMPGEDPLAFEGTLTDVSSQASLVDRPSTLRLKGERGPRRLTLDGMLDFRTETPRQSLEVTYAGADLAGQRLGELGGPVSVARGQGALRGKVEASGGTLDGEIRLMANDLELSFPPAADKLTALLQKTVSQVRSADATLRVSGPLGSPDLSLRSSLDKDLARAAGQALSAELAALRSQLEARLNAVVGEEIKKLQGNEALGPAIEQLGIEEKSLQSIEARLNEAIAKFSGTSGGEDPLKSLKGIFKK